MQSAAEVSMVCERKVALSNLCGSLRTILGRAAAVEEAEIAMSMQVDQDTREERRSDTIVSSEIGTVTGCQFMLDFPA